MRLLKLALPIVVGLATLELCLRLYNPLPFRVRGDRIILPIRQVYTFDNRSAPKLDPTIRHTKNSLGFRGPDPTADLARRMSVVTIGGSTTECLFLGDGKTWTDAMTRVLAPAVPSLWVNNAGLDGQSTYGHRVLLDTVIGPLAPKVAVFLIGTNDVERGAANTYDAALSPTGAGFAHRVSAGLANYSLTVSLAQNLVRAASARHRGFGHSQVDLRTARQLHLDDEAIAQLEAEHLARYVPGFGDRVTALVRGARAHGIEPVLVTQPILGGNTIDPATGVSLATVQVNGRGNGWSEFRLLERYNDRTRAVAAREHTLLIDLARELPKDSRLYYDFLHYTNDGAAAVGTIVGTRLLPFLQERFPDVTKRP